MPEPTRLLLYPLCFFPLWGCGGAAPCDRDLDVAVVGASLAFAVDGCVTGQLDAEVQGEGLQVELEVRDGAVVPVITGSGQFRGLHVAGGYVLHGDGPERWWRQGYQSWSWSGVVDAEAAPVDALGLPTVGGDGDAITVVQETPHTSWWVGALGRPDHGGFVVGALSADTTRWWAAAGAGDVHLVWGHRGEVIEVDGDLELDPLWIGAGRDLWQVQHAYAEAVAERAGVEPPPAPPISGWATWYVFYSDVREEDVRRNLAWMVDSGAPLTHLQIDDGWQRRWGEWTANDRFPSGIAQLAADIREAGFIPGVWMAPLYVHRDAAAYRDHPDWWVRDADGAELSFTNLGTGDYAVIDVTHPDAGAWMAQQVRQRVDEGFGYLKLDFLYAAAQEGLRREAVTGVQAYHRALALLRQAAGDADVLACGAPMLPTVGYAQSFRSGADIAFEVSPDPSVDYYRWQARATAARSWQHGVWWWNDPDQVIYREPLTDVQATGAVVSTAVAGGPWLLGDDMPALQARAPLGLNPEIIALRGTQVVPREPLEYPSGIDGSPVIEAIQRDDRAPLVWDFASGHTALLNLGAVPVRVDGPGGRELLSGRVANPGEATLAPGEGQIWAPE